MSSMMQTRVLVLLTIIHIGIVTGETSDFPGHLKSFGTGPSSPVDVLHQFPSVKDFFNNYVIPSRPVKFAGVVRDTFPLKNWSDEYFLSLDLSADVQGTDVVVETKKKEDRKLPSQNMHFQDFVKLYQQNELYMVQPIPSFLSPDVFLPMCLHCSEFYNDKMIEAIMWFSNGGTKSVVHTDSVDNINCLYAGEKKFFMVNPHIYRDKVDLDHPEGAYSSMDVDSVDFEKFPGMAEVEFIVANMTAGDCLYIPYKWIHQVRSYHRNIAVNLWWDNHRSINMDLNRCSDDELSQGDTVLTLDQVNFVGFRSETISIETIRDHFYSMVGVKDKLPVESFYDYILKEALMLEEDRNKNLHTAILQQMTALVDKNEDGFVTKDEIEEVTEQEWELVKEGMIELEELLMDYEENYLDFQESSEQGTHAEQQSTHANHVNDDNRNGVNREGETVGDKEYFYEDDFYLNEDDDESFDYEYIDHRDEL